MRKRRWFGVIVRIAQVVATLAASVACSDPVVYRTLPQDSGTEAQVLADVDNDDAALDPDAGCAWSIAPTEVIPSHVLFLVDRSGSMNCNLPEDGQTSSECAQFPVRKTDAAPTKGELVEEALSEAFFTLAESGSASAGLSLFPAAGTQCDPPDAPDVPLDVVDEPHREDLEEAMRAVRADGDTPLAGAVIKSYAYLLKRLRAGALPGNPFVVVITDGSETCKPSELRKLLDTDVPNAYALLAIRTFVIGAPGSEDGRALLSEMAVAGGTADPSRCSFGPDETDGDCHFDMTRTQHFADELRRALASINVDVARCELSVPEAPGGRRLELDRVNVRVDGVSYPMADGECDPDVASWHYSKDRLRILLCGDACSRALEPAAQVELVFGCPTQPL
ncbi:MAG: VWA domain-containing protein [Polyangiaceae bacterium]|nr:VWA domain-containing protein [Polyangiaceae bacterium]